MSAADRFRDPPDLTADADLDEDQRDTLAQYLTPRTGHGGVTVWPIDELANVDELLPGPHASLALASRPRRRLWLVPS